MQTTVYSKRIKEKKIWLQISVNRKMIKENYSRAAYIYTQLNDHRQL